MGGFERLQQRLTDPVFYRKRWARLTKGVPYRPSATVSINDLPHGPILVAIAHPDDEMFCSGLICELGKDREVNVFCTTRGEGGATGGLIEQSGLGKLREEELRASCRALGVDSVEFGNYIDPLAKTYRIYAPSIPPGKLEQQLVSYSPSLIVTHGSGGEYWHPAHLQLHDAVAKLEVPTLTMNAWQPEHMLTRLLNIHDPADLLIDVTRHREKRLAALMCHQTQRSYFEEVAGGQEAFIDATSSEGYCLWK